MLDLFVVVSPNWVKSGLLRQTDWLLDTRKRPQAVAVKAVPGKNVRRDEWNHTAVGSDWTRGITDVSAVGHRRRP